jgi:Co/Zn/Cd efflux system component
METRKYGVNMAHHHHSSDNSELLTSTGGRLLITMILNFIITIAEIIGGIFSGSLSLIADALHNFSDGVAVILSGAEAKIGKKFLSPYLRTETRRNSGGGPQFIGAGCYFAVSLL